MTTIFIDIETLPTKRADIIEDIRFSISAPANYSKPETIAKWIEENGEAEFDKQLRKTALDGLYGEIFSIAWAIGDEDPVAVSTANQTEKEMLEEFFISISDLNDKHGQRVGITKWVGHYITGFDLRFIWQRCVINQVKPAVSIPYDAKPWDAKVFDTKIAWTGATSYSGAGSLDKLSKAFDLDGKGDIDGSKVYDYWLAGKFDEIIEYNKRDVIACRELYKRMNFI